MANDPPRQRIVQKFTLSRSGAKPYSLSVGQMGPLPRAGRRLGTWGTRRWLGLGLAVASTAAMGVVRFTIVPLLGARITFVVFYPAILVSAWCGGFASGLLSTILSALLIGYFWLPPVGSFAIADAGEAFALTLFVGTGVAMSAVHETLLRERRRLAMARAVAQEAREAAERAEREVSAANRAKDEFLSVLSHELRTPMTAVLGWANILRTRTVDRATRTRALATIERNAQAQAQLIEDVLDVSRIVAGKLRIEPCSTDPRVAIATAVDTLRPSADGKQIQLHTALAPEACAIFADPSRLQQMVWNLLSNAIKFTPRGGKVELRLERIDDRARISVTDNGRGIDPRFLPHVFDRFRQADASPTRSEGGLGLGLAIVKHLVELHGGRAFADSTGLGSGATFAIELPLAAEPPLKPSVPPPSDAASLNLNGTRVLVVDDEPDARELVATVLSEFGATVEVAASAAQALEVLRGRQVDVLVADISMPGENGYELMERVRGLQDGRELGLPALALTACVSARDVMLARHAGFLAHIAKPVLPEELVRAVVLVRGHATAALSP
jgi:signal transduction histidine kinase/CheY-like chemotaxis protein